MDSKQLISLLAKSTKQIQEYTHAGLITLWEEQRDNYILQSTVSIMFKAYSSLVSYSA